MNSYFNDEDINYLLYLKNNIENQNKFFKNIITNYNNSIKRNYNINYGAIHQKVKDFLSEFMYNDMLSTLSIREKYENNNVNINKIKNLLKNYCNHEWIDDHIESSLIDPILSKIVYCKKCETIQSMIT